MKKTMKKVLAIVLTVLMCVSVVLPVMAEGTTSGCPGVGVAHTLANCTNYETYKTYAPTCEKDGYTHYQCKVCSVFFADSWVDRPNANGLCVWEVTTKASCFADGVETCKNCGATKAIEKRAHSELVPVDGSPVCGTPDTKITLKCTNAATDKYVACTHTEQGDASQNHDWKIDVTVQPSCGVKGEASYTCKRCSFNKTMEIYSTGDHDLEDVEAVEEDCTTDGNHAHKKCKDCGLLLMGGVVVDEEDVVIEAHHTYDAETPTAVIWPTCTTPGFKFYGCTACGQTAATETLSMLPHITDPADRGKTNAADITLSGEIKTPLDCTLDQDEVTEYECCGNKHEDDTSATEPTCGFRWTAITCEVGSEEAEDRGHEIEVIVVKPNCTEGGYTYKFCAACNEAKHTDECEDECTVLHGQIGEVYDETDPVEGKHVWADSEYINAPSCTASGTAVSYCTKCNIVESNRQVDALGHSWEREGVSLDDLTPTLNCVLGVLEYACTECTDLEGRVHTVAVPNFNRDDIKFHISYDETAENNWVRADGEDGINHYRDGSCTVGSLDIYTCDCGYSILIEGEASHVKSNVTPYVAPLCLTNGRHGSWTCSVCNGTAYTDATGEVVVFVEADEDVADVEDFSVIIPMLSENGKHLNKTVYKAFAGATCATAGNTEGWYCNVCCDFVADEDEEVEDDDDAPTITLKVGAVNSLENPAFAMSEVIEPLDHENKVMDDWANLSKNGDTFVYDDDGRIVRVPTCLEYAYAHYVCPDCDLEYWDDYKKELGHDTEEVEISADCDNGGYNLVVCKRGDLCDLTAETLGGVPYKVVEKEAVARLEHKDAEGNPIKCVFEDFICSVCSPAVDGDGDPILDAEGEQVMNLVDWERSHDYVETEYEKTCVSYGYTLTSCTTCHDGKVEENTVDGFGPHTYAADPTSNKPVVTIDGKTWTVTKEPTYAAAGSKYQKCTVCGDKVTDDNYVKTDMKLAFTTTNAKKADAAIVNSGLIAVTIKTHAYKLPIWGLELSIKYNNQLVAFEGFEVNNASFKDTTKVASKNVESDGITTQGYVDRDEIVTVLATAGNGTDGKAQNVEVNGDGVAFVTVYFRVLDNTVGGNAAFTIVENSVEVVDKTAAEKTVSSVGTIPSAAIKALGDVNGDAEYTAAGVATVKDAIALQLIVEKNNGTYNAMADIDKDGKVTVADFGYLMQYISGEIAYNELCAIGVKA